MYDCVWLCLTMQDYVWLCTYDYVWLCMTIYDYVWLCKTMNEYVWLCMTMCYYVWHLNWAWQKFPKRGWGDWKRTKSLTLSIWEFWKPRGRIIFFKNVSILSDSHFKMTKFYPRKNLNKILNLLNFPPTFCIFLVMPPLIMCSHGVFGYY